MPGSFFDTNVVVYTESGETAKAARTEAAVDSIYEDMQAERYHLPSQFHSILKLTG
jgi:hypothetical protein